MNEVTAYGAAWKRGQLWTVPPATIPISHVTRAGYLWRMGETYRRDTGSCPSCWVPVTPPRPAPDAPATIERHPGSDPGNPRR